MEEKFLVIRETETKQILHQPQIIENISLPQKSKSNVMFLPFRHLVGVTIFGGCLSFYLSFLLSLPYALRGLSAG